MKRYGNLVVLLVSSLSLSGCMNPQGQPDYTASGALGGAATGAIIGSAARHPGAGAAIGAAIGAVTGGVIGHGMDQAQEMRNAQIAQAQQQAQQTSPLKPEDIISLTRAKFSDDLIISQIRNSRTVYHLSTADIISLKRAGVSEKVIDYMINTPSLEQTAPQASVATSPPPAPLVEPVVVAPGPDYYWIPGVWFWLDDRWTWRRGYWHEPYHYRYNHHGYRRWR